MANGGKILFKESGRNAFSEDDFDNSGNGKRRSKLDRKKEKSFKKQGLVPLPQDMPKNILIDEETAAESLPKPVEKKTSSFSKSDEDSKELEDLGKDLEKAFSIKLESGALTLKNKGAAKKPEVISEKRENILAERKDIISQTKNNKLKIINNLFDVSALEPENNNRAKAFLKELKFEKFKIKIENFNARGLKDTRLKEFEKCVEDANAEILKRVNERRAELEVFLEKNQKNPATIFSTPDMTNEEPAKKEHGSDVEILKRNGLTKDSFEISEPADELMEKNNPTEDAATNNTATDEEHRNEKGYEPEKEIKEKIITGADLIGEESDRKIKELGDKLEKARIAYLKKDTEAEKIKLSLKSVLWKTLKIGSLGQYDKEHEDAKNEYNEALKAYKEEFLKAGLIEDKEDVRIMVDFLNLTETSSREKARTDIKAENSKWWHLDNVSKGYMKIVESYKNIGKDDKSKLMRFIKKGAVGVAIGGGVAFAGGAVAGAMGSIAGATAFRLFTMSVSATGFKGIFEGIADKKRATDSAKEAEIIFRNSKTEGMGEMKAELISENLNLMIKNIDGKMQKNKQTARLRSLGAFLTAGAISNLGQIFGHEIMETVKEHFSDSLPVSTGGSFAEKTISGLSENNAVEKVIELKPVKVGGSIEGSIREYLESNPELINKYNGSSLSGGRKFDAGQIAFRMFDELSKNHNVTNLPPGTKINLSADGLHIKEIPGFNLKK